MSQLATKLAVLEPPERVRRGPANSCHPVYGDGDLEDWQAVMALHTEGRTWREVQRIVDAQVGVGKPLALEKFKYHWRRRCFCWPDDLRQA